MFDEGNLHKLSSAGGFTLWFYDVGADRPTAEAARNQMGFFPIKGKVQIGDAVYIQGAGQTTHHWVSRNQYENSMALCLFGG